MTRETKLVGAMLALAGAGIVFLTTLSTFLLAAGAPSQLRTLFRVMCHGLENRCLIVFGTAMPVCSRCVAIYGGLLAGVALFAAIGWLRSHPLATWGLAVTLLPLAVDGITQAAGLRESTNELRMLTGLLAGSGFAIWSLGAVEAGSRERLKMLKFEPVTREKPRLGQP